MKPVKKMIDIHDDALDEKLVDSLLKSKKKVKRPEEIKPASISIILIDLF